MHRLDKITRESIRKQVGSAEKVAKEYGVSTATVYRIKNAGKDKIEKVTRVRKPRAIPLFVRLSRLEDNIQRVYKLLGISLSNIR